MKVENEKRTARDGGVGNNSTSGLNQGGSGYTTVSA